MRDPFPGPWVMHGVVVLVPFLGIAWGLRWSGRPLRFGGPAVGVLLGCCIVAAIPFRGLRPAGWLLGVMPGCSIPLLVLLLHGCLKACEGPPLLNPSGLRTVAWFGIATGLILYPGSLGWGSWDPYAAGWGARWLFAVVGTLAAACLLVRNGLGIVLLAAITAWHLGILESRNYWDYLVDPMLLLVCLPLAIHRRAVSPAAPVAATGS